MRTSAFSVTDYNQPNATLMGSGRYWRPDTSESPQPRWTTYSSAKLRATSMASLLRTSHVRTPSTTAVPRSSRPFRAPIKWPRARIC